MAFLLLDVKLKDPLEDDEGADEQWEIVTGGMDEWRPWDVLSIGPAPTSHIALYLGNGEVLAAEEGPGVIIYSIDESKVSCCLRCVE